MVDSHKPKDFAANPRQSGAESAMWSENRTAFIALAAGLAFCVLLTASTVHLHQKVVRLTERIDNCQCFSRPADYGQEQHISSAHDQKLTTRRDRPERSADSSAIDGSTINRTSGYGGPSSVTDFIQRVSLFPPYCGLPSKLRSAIKGSRSHFCAEQYMTFYQLLVQPSRSENPAPRLGDHHRRRRPPPPRQSDLDDSSYPDQMPPAPNSGVYHAPYGGGDRRQTRPAPPGKPCVKNPLGKDHSQESHPWFIWLMLHGVYVQDVRLRQLDTREHVLLFEERLASCIGFRQQPHNTIDCRREWAFRTAGEDHIGGIHIHRSGSYKIQVSTAVQISSQSNRTPAVVELMVAILPRGRNRKRRSDRLIVQNNTRTAYSISSGSSQVSMAVEGIFSLCRGEEVRFVIQSASYDSVISFDRIQSTRAHFIYLGNATASGAQQEGAAGRYIKKSWACTDEPPSA